jgi:hypothetical protein
VLRLRGAYARSDLRFASAPSCSHRDVITVDGDVLPNQLPNVIVEYYAEQLAKTRSLARKPLETSPIADRHGVREPRRCDGRWRETAQWLRYLGAAFDSGTTGGAA